MKSEEPPKWLIVRADAVSDGYMEKSGAFIRNRPYRIHARNSDGNVIVYNPAWVAWYECRNKEGEE